MLQYDSIYSNTEESSSWNDNVIAYLLLYYVNYVIFQEQKHFDYKSYKRAEVDFIEKLSSFIFFIHQLYSIDTSTIVVKYRKAR